MISRVADREQHGHNLLAQQCPMVTLVQNRIKHTDVDYDDNDDDCTDDDDNDGDGTDEDDH